MLETEYEMEFYNDDNNGLVCVAALSWINNDYYEILMSYQVSLQCFDTVGWEAGRASGP